MNRIESILDRDQLEVDDVSSRSQPRSSFSLNDMDASAGDFWNMTLDDLTRQDHEDDEEDTFGSSSFHPLSVNKNEPKGRQHRRRSDGMLIPSSAATATTTTQPKKKNRGLPRRRVSFGKVQVREHVRVLGDNPCFEGPSLSLGWKYHDKFTNQGGALCLQAFEKKRHKEKQRSHQQQLALSPLTREKIAKRFGYTSTEIAENVKQVQTVQRRRERTRMQVEKESLQELTMSRQETTLQRFLQAQASKNYGGQRRVGAAALRV